MRIGLILGDQLSHSLATLRVLDPVHDRLLFAEVRDEATYVRHHKQKIALIFSAMRHFAAELGEQGWQVDYHAYDPDCAQQSLIGVLQQQVARQGADEVILTRCGEYRLQRAIDHDWSSVLGVPVQLCEDDRFVCSSGEFAAWASGRRQLRMEFFYREMRRKTGLLMENGAPLGGQWNFDADNRSAYDSGAPLPPALEFGRDSIDNEVLALVEAHFADHPGSLDRFDWATTRSQALEALAHFIAQRLPWFGDYQDAMLYGEDFLFHSLLSPYINCGLLTPMEVCEAAEQAYWRGDAPLNAVEGFIRQIIGWREYVRGIYWLCMPDYAQQNLLGNERALPAMYWHGETGMACMRESFRNTFDHAYAHHIQRLMVTGNFALLAGIRPQDVCDWYLMVYADAYDWVELPNTLGMVMHADGGYLGSKPYCASGNYINRMSDYCRHCEYSVRTATDNDSCPFNSLYWHFVARHRDKFRANPRMRMIYRSYERMADDKKNALQQRAEHLLTRLDEL
ncbi:deoxyribodipyrimidine photo-lyase [Marinobacterium nitratireducens]|uniref:Deoxyribodipyrimidine photo-lyase n=1 Tax=Marinobacterium nitratireducens TaxID=518897 RepID=A0A918DXF1_9GAMM|nr:cryptochrome/photolyase family protein [Marinobacterium nitratireducens]GGO86475.1 deoxyribodipyrimidine photo-lyase [Marinobacterium nitratireducens]